MNIFIAVLLFFALLGLFDKLCNNRLGLAPAFDNGLKSMGDLCISMSGIYCIAVTALNQNPDLITGLFRLLPFDPSLLFGALLSPDMGGFTIASATSATKELGLYSGLLLSSTLGCLISFVLPISLGTISQSEIVIFMKGILYGILVLPVGLLFGGFLLKLPLMAFLWNFFPILGLCLLLTLALWRFPKGCLAVFSFIGQTVRIISLLLFLLLAAGIFFPAVSFVPENLVHEVLLIVFRIAIVVSGSMVISHLVLTHKRNLLTAIGKRFGINEYAAVGLFLSLATSISMLPLFSKMDERGKAMNAAFTVSGAFVLGGQLAFVSSIASSSSVTAYMVCKLTGGILGILLALLLTPQAHKS